MVVGTIVDPVVELSCDRLRNVNNLHRGRGVDGAGREVADVAAVVEGVCDGTGFPATVTAIGAGTDLWPGKTVFLIV